MADETSDNNSNNSNNSKNSKGSEKSNNSTISGSTASEQKSEQISGSHPPKHKPTSFEKSFIPPALPVVEPKKEQFKPMPYVFRLPDQSINHSILTSARSPPFAIQLDHAIAVVWSLYSSEETECPLGINQLQWAYNFLHMIRDRDNDHPPDVSHCLDTISDELIEQYAELAEDVQKTRSVQFVDEFGEPLATSSEMDHSKCTCPKSDKPKEDENKSKCKTAKDNLDFSITYSDMKSHLDAAQLGKKEDPPLKPCNEDQNVAALLNDWRKDQLNKIMAELDRLHSIENYISKTGKDFDPYLDEKDREMHEYLTKKLACNKNDCPGKSKNGSKENEETEST